MSEANEWSEHRQEADRSGGGMGGSAQSHGMSESTDWTGSLDCGMKLRPNHLTLLVSVPSCLLSAVEDASDEE